MILRVGRHRGRRQEAHDGPGPLLIISRVTNLRNDHYWPAGRLVRVAAGAVDGLGDVDGIRACCDLRIRSWIAITTSLGVCHFPLAQMAVTSLIALAASVRSAARVSRSAAVRFAALSATGI